MSAAVQRQVNQPHRILVVESDPFSLPFSAEVLIQHGYEVNATEDGEAAWEELQTINYHLLDPLARRADTITPRRQVILEPDIDLSHWGLND